MLGDGKVKSFTCGENVEAAEQSVYMKFYLPHLNGVAQHIAPGGAAENGTTVPFRV